MMKTAILLDDLCGHAVNSPQTVISIEAWSTVRVKQISEDLGKFTLYSIVTAEGHEVNVYAWELKNIKEEDK